MKKLFVNLIIYVLILLIFFTISSIHKELYEITKVYPDEFRSYYIPSSLQVKIFSLGYYNAVSDLLFIWFLQFYDWYNKSVRYSYMEHTFNVMTDLDPKHVEAYSIAALFAFIPLKYELVYKFLDKGIEKNPDNYILPFDAGMYAFFSEKNYERAAKYFEIAYKRNPNKAILKNFYAKSLSLKGDLKSALEYFKEIYLKYKDDNTYEGNYYKMAALRHIFLTELEISIKKIEEAIKAFVDKYGKNPDSLRALVKEGLLDEIPLDPFNKPFLYDPKTGQVICQSEFDPKAFTKRW